MAMRSDRILILAGGLLVGAAACTPVDPSFGEAARYDEAIQTIDPDPVYPANALQPGYFGEKAQKATERYRKGTTKPLRIESAGGGGGGGSSGVGSGGSTPGGSN
jgi:hypothetical protein